MTLNICKRNTPKKLKYLENAFTDNFKCNVNQLALSSNEDTSKNTSNLRTISTKKYMKKI